MKKPSLLDRLTGSALADDAYDDLFDDDNQSNSNHNSNTQKIEEKKVQIKSETPNSHIDHWEADIEDDGELSVDVYQTNEHVVVKALVAGVMPSNLDISLTRDMITISGTREEAREVEDDEYFQKELYWGSFSRTILLPEEVDVDAADAIEKHGILMIRLPKINKSKATKLKVKSR
jgi:HSP20 family molecular chaperone IbpA